MSLPPPDAAGIELLLAQVDQQLAQDPGSLPLSLRRAQLLNPLRRYAEAIACCEALLIQYPHCAELWSEIASNYLDSGSLDAAEFGFRMALERAPGHPEHLYNLSLVLQKRCQLAEAESLLWQAVALNPEHRQAWCNMGSVLDGLGRPEEALDVLNRAMALSSQDPDCRWNRSLVLLRLGRYQEGWAEYESRYTLLPRPTTPRTWRGELRPTETLWVACEQGLGDSLQFVRFLPQARQRVGRLVLACPPALQLLLSQQGLADDVVASDGTPPYPFSVRLMSLPHVLDLSRPADLASPPYLRVDPARVARMRERFPADGRPLVAVAWQGSKAYAADAMRSIPLRALWPVLHEWPARFVSVQKGVGHEQLQELPAGLLMEGLSEADDQDGAFTDTAALLTLCDALVASDSALAHLAGALGVRCLLLLPHVADWRWGHIHDSVPWYPSTELFRQDRPGDWASAVDKLMRRGLGSRRPFDQTSVL